MAPLFSFITRLCLVFIVQAAFLSAFAVSSVLVHIVYSYVKSTRNRQTRRFPRIESHVYFVNLMIFNLIQAIGTLIHIKWIATANIEEGVVCTAQGAIKQIGDVGTALTSLAIGADTLFVIAFRLNAPRKVSLFTTLSIWLFVILIVAIPSIIHRDGTIFAGKYFAHYYGNAGLWCWIARPYVQKEGIGLLYVWMWVAVAGNSIIYIFLALLFKGIVVVDESARCWIRFATADEKSKLAKLFTGEMETIVRGLLFYPIVYIITVVPHTAARLPNIIHPDRPTVPFPVVIISAVIFSLNGLLNVILFAVTRPGLFPSRKASQDGFELSSRASEHGQASPGGFVVHHDEEANNNNNNNDNNNSGDNNNFY